MQHSKFKIFISANQKEMKTERLSLRAFILSDVLLKKHFDVFVFEDTPAKGISSEATYLEEVRNCDVYIGILGNQYGNAGKDGLSATEKEFKLAEKRNKEILVFLKGPNEFARDKKLVTLINHIKKPAKGCVYKRFENVNGLKSNVYESLIMFLENKGVISSLHFDTQICKGATLKDIDPKKVKWFIERAREARGFGIPAKTSIKEALERLDLIHREKLINSAILLFGKRPQKYFVQAKIRCGRIKGISGHDFLDMKILEGTIPELRESAMRFIAEHIKKAVYFDANQRYDKWEYPLRALEEVITNALAHRDYLSNSDIQLAIYDDRIEVWNPGELPRPLVPADLKKKHKSIPRNKLLASNLFLIKHIERWGMGTNRIMDEMRANGLSDPKFQNLSGGFEVTLFGPGKAFEREIEKGKLHTLEISERQKRAIKHLKANDVISTKAYMKLNKVSDKTAFLELNDLLKKDLLVKEGKGRATTYKLKR
ncbi:MAG: DUF4062 domain-containing protein [Candidatus Saganbacteria bacterium]|nr:DUF4062 domain-containing protein [Candidatus Saganbacteria bacterium]